MPRQDLSAAMLGATQATVFLPAIFVQATLASGTLYLWSGLGNTTWNGQTWQGVGSLLKISTVEEKATVAATGLVVTLSGINPTLLANVLNEFNLTGPVKVFLGAFSSPGVLIPDPITLWSGALDQPTIDVGGDSASISINCESRLLEMNVSVERRYTDQDQQLDVPGDLAFSFVNSIQDQPVYWGQTPTNSI
jgi:hypothetical protein